MERGLVQRVIDPTGKFVEYWIYKDKTSGYIDGATGQYAHKPGYESCESAPDEVPERELYRVIICENVPEHIVRDKEHHLVVNGFKCMDDEEYPDLTDYLGKTGRHL